MGITRDSWHKRRSTGGKKKPIRKGRKFELGRPPANTKIGQKRIHVVRVRGGNKKYRALRLDHGNFSWGSEAVTHKARILDVVYNATNNELVRTKTLVKNCIIQIDAAPFRKWYESHYGQSIGKRRGPAKDVEEEVAKQSNHLQRKLQARKPMAKVDPHVEEQFSTGRLYACVASRPGQCGRCDGYILEGRELEFYVKKSKKGK